VGREGSVVWQGVQGLANLERRDKITARTVFDIGSVTKQFTGTAILLLAQAGRLRLDDPLARHLAGLPRWSTRVTLRELLHHTSGIPDYLSLLAEHGHPESELTTRKQALATLQRAALDFEPASDWAYSNSNYLLLADVVRNVSGESLPRFLRESIFRPLGLDMVMDPRAAIPSKALSYAHDPSSGFSRADAPYEQVGDAGVQTTPAELVRWADNYRSGKVGGDRLATAVLEDAADSRRGDGVRYGAGIAQLPDGSLWHDGRLGGFLTEFWISRDRTTSVAIACNRNQIDATGMRETISSIWTPP
jgi:CubicO group peptidase (beta-lactamase class C family)